MILESTKRTEIQDYLMGKTITDLCNGFETFKVHTYLIYIFLNALAVEIIIFMMCLGVDDNSTRKWNNCI